tara:strand:- start:886 stop:1149 length:264 start_codon:yes stop_codon:yes gene_type:complete
MSNKTKGFTDWNDIARTVLLGKRIVRVEYIGKNEALDYMWDKRGVSFVLDDGTRIIAMRDDEGNDAGVLAYLNKDVDSVLPTIGMED